MGSVGEKPVAASKLAALEAELVTGLKPMVLGRGRRGKGGGGKGRGTYDCRVQIHCITYPYPYPVCTGTYHPFKLYPTICLAVFFWQDPSRSSVAHVWPLGLMSDDKSVPDEFRRPEPFSLDLSSHRTTIYCRSLKQPGVR